MTLNPDKQSTCKSSIRARFFPNRVIYVWNFLPPTVSFTSLISFNQSLDCINLSDRLNFLLY